MSSRVDSPYGSGRSSPSLEGADSGYSSGNNSESDLPELSFTKAHLRFLNRQLQFLEPQEILRWAITTLPNLYQTTAFGLTGLVQLDMLSKLKVPRPQLVDLVFFDTLYHFPETLELVERVRTRYPLVNIHTFKPAEVNTAQEFEDKYGERLWETDDNRYDYLVKVEPAQRAYRELNAYAVITGRRRTQGGARGSLDIIEVDEAGLLKINPRTMLSLTRVTKVWETGTQPNPSRQVRMSEQADGKAKPRPNAASTTLDQSMHST